MQDTIAVALSPREHELLGLVAEAKPNKIIAYETGLTEGSVKVYLSHLYKKIGASNRGEAIRYAIKRGLATV